MHNSECRSTAPSRPMPESPLMDSLNVVNKGMAVIHEHLSQLEVKLQPVLMPTGPSEKDGGGAGVAQNVTSPAVEASRDAEIAIKQIVARIVSLNVRLTL